MEKILNITVDQLWSVQTKEFWTGLGFMPDALRILEILENHFGVENICILSTPTKHLDCMAGKLEWIQKNLPRYSRRFLFGPQKQFCSHPNAVLIDDFVENTDKFSKWGGISYLIPRPWNPAHNYYGEAAYKLSQFLETL